MLIGILTQPLKTNYGGLLQAYALQETLRRLGFSCIIINRDYNRPKLNETIKYSLKKLFFQIFPTNHWFYKPTSKEYQIISQNTQAFIDKYLNKSKGNIQSDSALRKYVNQIKPNAFIVGSDQVWRPQYSPNIYNYYLDFIQNDPNVKKISYAASFGVDDWEYTERETMKCKSLIQLFDSVSVREDTAVNLCQDYFNVKSVHVLDPTLLLEREYYIQLVNDNHPSPSKGNLMTYILDLTEEKRKIIKVVASKLSLTPFSVMPEKELDLYTRKNIRQCIYPSVYQWIKGFIDAEYVVVDSFHGCVFSIIFNKPFLVIGNESRGMTRFQSLLKMFQLEDRLIYSLDELDENRLLEKIDWEQVNLLKDKLKQESLNFLVNNLKI